MTFQATFTYPTISRNDDNGQNIYFVDICFVDICFVFILFLLMKGIINEFQSNLPPSTRRSAETIFFQSLPACAYRERSLHEQKILIMTYPWSSTLTKILWINQDELRLTMTKLHNCDVVIEGNATWERGFPSKQQCCSFFYYKDYVLYKRMQTNLICQLEKNKKLAIFDKCLAWWFIVIVIRKEERALLWKGHLMQSERNRSCHR